MCVTANVAPLSVLVIAQYHIGTILNFLNTCFYNLCPGILKFYLAHITFHNKELTFCNHLLQVPFEKLSHSLQFAGLWSFYL